MCINHLDVGARVTEAFNDPQHFGRFQQHEAVSFAAGGRQGAGDGLNGAAFRVVDIDHCETELAGRTQQFQRDPEFNGIAVRQLRHVARNTVFRFTLDGVAPVVIDEVGCRDTGFGHGQHQFLDGLILTREGYPQVVR